MGQPLSQDGESEKKSDDYGQADDLFQMIYIMIDKSSWLEAANKAGCPYITTTEEKKA